MWTDSPLRSGGVSAARALAWFLIATTAAARPPTGLPAGYAPVCATRHVAVLQPRVDGIGLYLPVSWSTVLGNRSTAQLNEEGVLVDGFRAPMPLPLPPGPWLDVHVEQTVGEATSPGPAGQAPMNPDLGVYGWARTPSQRVHLLRWRPPMYPGEEGMVVEPLGTLPEDYSEVGLAAPGPRGELYVWAAQRRNLGGAKNVYRASAGVVSLVETTPLVGGGSATVVEPPDFDAAGNRFGLVLVPGATSYTPVVWRWDSATGAPGTLAEPLPEPEGATQCIILDAGGQGVAVGMCGSVVDVDEEAALGAERGVLWRLNQTGAEVQTVAGARPSALTAVRPDGVAVGRWLRTDQVVNHPMLFQEGEACDLWRSVAPGHGLSGFTDLFNMADDGSLFFQGADARHQRRQSATLIPIYTPLALSGPAPAARGVPAQLTVSGGSVGADLRLYVSGDAPEGWTSWSVPACPGVVLPFEPVGPPSQPTSVAGDAATFAWTPPASGVYPMWARVVDHTTCEASQTHPLVVLD